MTPEIAQRIPACATKLRDNLAATVYWTDSKPALMVEEPSAAPLTSYVQLVRPACTILTALLGLAATVCAIAARTAYEMAMKHPWIAEAPHAHHVARQRIHHRHVRPARTATQACASRGRTGWHRYACPTPTDAETETRLVLTEEVVLQ